MARIGIAVTLGLTLVLSGFSCRKAPEPVQTSAAVGQAAPAFSLEELGGGRVDLGSLKGRVVLVDFWATWCPPCRDSMKALKALHSQRSAEDFTIVSVAVEPDRDAVRAFVEEQDIPFPVALDDGATARAYRVQEVPALFLVDRSGMIVHWAVGFSGALEKRLAGWIDEAMAAPVASGPGTGHDETQEKH